MLKRIKLSPFLGITLKNIRNYGTGGICKYVVARSTKYQDKYALYLNVNESIRVLESRLRKIYQRQNIHISTNQKLYAIGDIQSTQQFSQTSSQSIVHNLFMGELQIYEKDQRDRIIKIYVFEISQFNPTSNNDVSREFLWLRKYLFRGEGQEGEQATVGDLARFSHIQKPFMERQDQSKIVGGTALLMNQLIKYHNAKQKNSFYLPQSNRLTKIIIPLMSINWLLLFSITFCGLGGWKVGQPMFLITNLFLFTLIFQQTKIFYKQQFNQQQHMQQMRKMSKYNIIKWRIQYYKRLTLI